jgi:SAM-dependent methyltransferase
MDIGTGASEVVQEVIRRKPMHRKFLQESIRALDAAERLEAERYIEFMRAEGLSPSSLASAYLVIVDDTFREELRFRETGRYRYSTFAEANEAVYSNAGYMRDYMVGLALSSFWWRNHSLMRRFFKQQLSQLCREGATYREVGPGHGMYLLEALRSGRFSSYEGVDVSATSIQLTRRVVEGGFFGPLPLVRLLHADFLASRDLEPTDVLVMGEVLEHLEDPHVFMRRAAEVVLPGGRLFLTTCINAPAVDHLYNPETVVALESLFALHGFSIVERVLLGRDGKPIDECERQRLAINVAYVLAR